MKQSSCPKPHQSSISKGFFPHESYRNYYSFHSVKEATPTWCHPTVKHECSPPCCIWNRPFFCFLNQPSYDLWVVPPPPFFLHLLSSTLPSLCVCLSGPVPISKPWGVDSSTHSHWVSHAGPGFCLLFIFVELRKLLIWELLSGKQVSTH